MISCICFYRTHLKRHEPVDADDHFRRRDTPNTVRRRVVRLLQDVRARADLRDRAAVRPHDLPREYFTPLTLDFRTGVVSTEDTDEIWKTAKEETMEKVEQASKGEFTYGR